MVLGDSIVAGFEVPWEEKFTARMESLLTAELGIPVQVINAACAATAATRAISTIATAAPASSPISSSSCPLGTISPTT